MSDRPRGRDDLRSQALGPEMLLYDRAADQVHVLNETAVQVWELCDGNHDDEAIVDRMIGRYPGVDHELIRADTLRVLEEFRSKGLLEGEPTH